MRVGLVALRKSAGGGEECGWVPDRNAFRERYDAANPWKERGIRGRPKENGKFLLREGRLGKERKQRLVVVTKAINGTRLRLNSRKTNTF